MAKRSKYGEETIFLSLRVPKSKKDEISDRFYSILGEYVVGGVKNKVVSEDNVPSWKEKLESMNSEKKSNPSDDSIKEQAPAESKDDVSESLKNERDYEVGLRYVDDLGHWHNCESGVVKFEKIQSLPWTTLVQSFNSKGAIRKGENNDFYTKRTFQGKLEILKHDSKDSAFIYAEQNFK